MTSTDEHPPKDTIEHSPNLDPPGSVPAAPAVGDAPASNELQTPPAVPTRTEMETAASPAHVEGVTDEPPPDPKIATLLGMFPDFDVSLLQSVLQSVSGDQDRAIDVLLGMSDPEYKSTVRPDAAQTELDEEIARRLMLEEREQQQRAWQPQEASPRVPYQERSRHSPRNAQQQLPEGDNMAQFQEQLGKFAETGKKTFNTLFSKVKAKIQEFDSSSAQEQPSGSGNPLPHGDSWNTPAQAQSYYDPNLPQSSKGSYISVTEPHPHDVSMNQSGAAGSPNPPGNVTPPTTTRSTNTTAVPVGSVDPSKIGLLPKRPVSLGSSSQPSTNVNDDEVEYVESPFEEPNRRRE